jgi:hypothetical protein
MAIIGSLAIKVQADLNDLLSGAADTIRTIDNIAKSAKNAPPQTHPALLSFMFLK